MDNRRIAAGHLASFITILIWGTTFISTKILLADFTPLEILVFRFMIGYIALMLIHPHLLKTRSFKEELIFISAGICGVTLYFLMENIALTYTLASNVGVIVSTAPLFTAVLAHFFLEGERLNRQFLAGFAVAIAGILLIAFNGSFVLKLNPIGDILSILAAVVWAIYSVLMRKASKFCYHTIDCTRRVFFYGLLFMIPALFLLDFNLGIDRLAKMPNLLNLLYLGFGASALCFVSWNWSVGILGAVKTSVYIYIIPVITILAAFFILHEEITGISLAGALLTLAGLFISERKQGSAVNKKTTYQGRGDSM